MIPDLSTAELMEMSYFATELVDRLFQYWITATFALVIASHFIGAQMTRYMFLLLETTYALYTIGILSRMMNSGSRLFEIIAALDERGESPNAMIYAPGISAISILLTFLIATFGAMYFVWLNFNKHVRAQTENAADT